MMKAIQTDAWHGTNGTSGPLVDDPGGSELCAHYICGGTRQEVEARE
jgi:hypothetical protein